MNFEIVTELSHLERVCQQARNVPAVMLDTEFVRTRTLYPRLGLIQMFDGETLSLIDPIELDDLSPLWAVSVKSNVTRGSDDKSTCSTRVSLRKPFQPTPSTTKLVPSST